MRSRSTSAAGPWLNAHKNKFPLVAPQVDLQRTFTFRNSKQTYTGIPIIAANMDTTGTFEMAQVLSKVSQRSGAIRQRVPSTLDIESQGKQTERHGDPWGGGGT